MGLESRDWWKPVPEPIETRLGDGPVKGISRFRLADVIRLREGSIG